LALSHCWVLSHRITTTKENIANIEKAFQLATFLQLSERQYKIARVLDVCYLWIDYLCIIQDDFLDWEHEASEWETSTRTPTS
jgi:hypothetical protein